MTTSNLSPLSPLLPNPRLPLSFSILARSFWRRRRSAAASFSATTALACASGVLGVGKGGESRRSSTGGGALGVLASALPKYSDIKKAKELEEATGQTFKRALKSMVYGYIRSLGWRRGLSVSFPRANYTVRCYEANWLSNLWENPCCFCLCHVTLVPCLAMRIYRGDCCCSDTA